MNLQPQSLKFSRSFYEIELSKSKVSVVGKYGGNFTTTFWPWKILARPEKSLKVRVSTSIFTVDAAHAAATIASTIDFIYLI
jgi:hypothetical protein